MSKVYFVYSYEQYNIRKQVEAKLGKIYIPGKVLVEGMQREYTDIITDLSINRYSDMKIIAAVDKDTAKYTTYK